MKKENEKKMNFIRTTDRETALYLRECGYTEITEPFSSTYCFINDGKTLFNMEEKKITYMNMLCI